MKNLLIAFPLLLLIGCGSDSGSKSDSHGTEAQGSNPIQWGDLGCQKSKTCENYPLNFSVEEWKAYREAFNDKPAFDLEGMDANSRALECGVRSYRVMHALHEEVGGATTAQTDQLFDFFAGIITLDNCRIDDLEQKLKNYFDQGERK